MCELKWNTALLTMALISDADVSMPAFELREDILNNNRHKLVRTLLIVIN